MEYNLPKPSRIEVIYETPKGTLTIVIADNIRGQCKCPLTEKDMEQFRYHCLPTPTPEKDWLP